MKAFQVTEENLCDRSLWPEWAAEWDFGLLRGGNYVKHLGHRYMSSGRLWRDRYVAENAHIGDWIVALDGRLHVFPDDEKFWAELGALVTARRIKERIDEGVEDT